MTSKPYKLATIANNTTTSGRVNLEGLKAGAILFPADFTGATITFELPDSAGGWADLATISLAKAVGDWVALTTEQAFALGDDFKIKSASSEGGARSLYVATR